MENLGRLERTATASLLHSSQYLRLVSTNVHSTEERSGEREQKTTGGMEAGACGLTFTAPSWYLLRRSKDMAPNRILFQISCPVLTDGNGLNDGRIHVSDTALLLDSSRSEQPDEAHRLRGYVDKLQRDSSVARNNCERSW